MYFDSIKQSSGFTVSGLGVDTGGAVTFAVPPATGVIVKILRTMTLERTTDYVEGGALRSDVLDDDFDRLWQAMQSIRADAASIVEFEALNGLLNDTFAAVENNANAAASSAADAAQSAGISTTQAGIATSASSTATTQAGIATTQAGIATTQSTAAVNAASSASSSASIAAAQAGISTTAAGTATTQAGIATTQAGIATAQAAAALVSEQNAESWAASVGNPVPRTSVTGSAVMPAGTTAQRDPSPSAGYTRFNTSTRSLETYDATASSWVPAGQGATGAVGNPVFYENDQTITGNYTIPATKNAMSTGPITVATGVTVTVSTGATWVVI